MKKIYFALLLAGSVVAGACKDDDMIPGNPVMDIQSSVSDAYFGDSLTFVIKASDIDVPLSTLKAQLFFGDEKVSETVIRTKVSGQDYTGKIYVPYLKDIPNGKATLKYVLQNINFTVTEYEQSLECSRPDFANLTLVCEDGTEYNMERKDLYQYEVKANFPTKVNAYIKAPEYGENGNEMFFGYDNDNQITQGSKSYISFSNTVSGEYSITFNTLTYEASPFVKILMNGTEMSSDGSDIYQIDTYLTTGQQIVFEGVPQYEEWWIDRDFFCKNEDGSLSFTAMAGDYRIMANAAKQYFSVEALNGDQPATLQADGSGAIWVIGEQVGKPSYTSNAVGWTPENALCMAQHEEGKYEITLVAGQQVNANAINFKFFHQKGWGGEFKQAQITSTSDIVVIPNEDGNLAIAEGKSLDMNGIYKFVVDVTEGIDNAVLSVQKIGDEEVETEDISLNGEQMTLEGPDVYSLVNSFQQNGALNVTGVSDWNGWFIDPDYFTDNGNGTFALNAVDGEYKIILSLAQKTMSAIRMNGNTPAVLGDDGHGALWLLGWGLGSPSLDKQFGWDLPNAFPMAEVEPNVYQFTGNAGPEKNSALGDRIRFDYVSFKVFKENQWDTEYKNDVLVIEGGLLKQNADGNIELTGELEEGSVYVIRVDLTKGNDKPVLTMSKK